MNQRIAIVGVGGAGGRIVNRAAETLGEEATVAAINTDSQALDELSVPARIQIGEAHTRGQGAGGDTGVGQLAAKDDIGLLRGLFAEVDLAVVVAGLGGGTGGGATPVVLRAARDSGALTLCFASLPFAFEGEARDEEAQRALERVRETADAVVAIPNDRLFETAEGICLPELFEQADAVLAGGVCAVWLMLARPGYINLDFADLRKVVRNSAGLCTFGYGEGTGSSKAGKAVEAVLNGPLLDHGEALVAADSLLVGILGGPDLTLKEIERIMAAVREKAGPATRIFMGTVIDNDRKKRVTLGVIVAGQQQQEKQPDAVHDRDDSVPPDRRRGRRRPGRKQLQAKLRLGTTGRGRFKDVEPTVLDGEDIDLPTYRRRDIPIDR